MILFTSSFFWCQDKAGGCDNSNNNKKRTLTKSGTFLVFLEQLLQGESNHLPYAPHPYCENMRLLEETMAIFEWNVNYVLWALFQSGRGNIQVKASPLPELTKALDNCGFLCSMIKQHFVTKVYPPKRLQLLPLPITHKTELQEAS